MIRVRVAGSNPAHSIREGAANCARSIALGSRFETISAESGTRLERSDAKAVALTARDTCYVPVRKFATRLLDVSNGTVALKEPVPFQGRIREDQLEDFIVREPELAGEPLLVLGRQL